jgi:hypothetical protein
VLVAEQSSDGRKFNRGKLLNVGFALCQGDGFDSFVFHGKSGNQTLKPTKP